MENMTEEILEVFSHLLFQFGNVRINEFGLYNQKLIDLDMDLG